LHNRVLGLMKFKYVHFVKTEDKPKTFVWSCRNNNSDDELGVVKWYAPWRSYCYFPTVQAVYSEGCLVDIRRFITEQMKARK
ncbi:hypothetical protein LCGC14_2635780, partial [marine sediment metagenome]